MAHPSVADVMEFDALPLKVKELVINVLFGGRGSLSSLLRHRMLHAVRTEQSIASIPHLDDSVS